MHNKGTSLTQRGREEGIRRLMSVNLLKRLESSVYSFNLTLSRIKELIENTIAAIDQFEKYGHADVDMYEASDTSDWDIDDQNTDFFSVGKKVKIDLADMDYKSWREELKKDAETLGLVTTMVSDIFKHCCSCSLRRLRTPSTMATRKSLSSLRSPILLTTSMIMSASI